MKSLINKTLAVAALIAASASMSFAQTRTIEHQYSEFDGIVAADGFKVSLALSDTYGTKVVVDDALESYVQCYVKSKTLYIGLDEKSIPKDLKKSYKGKNASDPTLTAIVYMPKLNSLALSDDASFSNTSTLVCDKFSLNLTDNCSISNMNVEAESAEITVAKKAKVASLNVNASDDLTVNGDGNGSVTVEYTAKNLNVNNAGSAELIINGDCKEVKVNTANSAKATISGNAEILTVSGKGGSSKVDATSLKVDDASIEMSGATACINAKKSIELNLGKGATVEYTGDPTVKIVEIQSASVVRK